MSNKRTRKDDEQHNSRKLSTHNLLEINKKISKISQKLQILGQIFPENFMLQKQNGAPLNFFWDASFWEINGNYIMKAMASQKFLKNYKF